MEYLTWGTFTPQHIVTIVLIFVTQLVIYLILKNKSKRVQKWTLFILSLWGIAAILYNLLMWNAPLEYLPLHMCSINALLLPIAILTNSKTIGNLLSIFSLGALAAIVFNSGQANYKMFSSVFLMYYVPHLFEFIIPWIQIFLGNVKLTYKNIIKTVVITLSLYTVIHFINIALNQYLINNNVLNYLNEQVQVNYMYSLNPEGNPALLFFWNIIPKQYFYMYAVMPIVVLLALLFTFVQNIIRRKYEKNNG